MGTGVGDVPFLRRIDQDNSGLHSVGIDAFNVSLKVLELFHGLKQV